VTLTDLLTGLADYKNTLANTTWVHPIETDQGAAAANVDSRSEAIMQLAVGALHGKYSCKHVNTLRIGYREGCMLH
jgi:hypothetical protein